MNINIGKGGDVRIVPVFKDTQSVEYAEELYSYLKDRGIFKGDSGELFADIAPEDDKVLILGLGDRDELTSQSIKVAFHKAGKKLMKLKVESIEIAMPEWGDIPYLDAFKSMIEGLLQSEYSFEKYIAEKKVIPSIENVYIDVTQDQREESSIAIEEVESIMEGIFLARDLVNEPAINMTPKKLSQMAVEELDGLGVDVKVYGREKIEELGMEAYLAVSRGSAQEPQFIVMQYEGNPDSDEMLALVGKGLTFDSGGYCIKPPKGMDTMHSDMAGAASVIGAMKSIAKSKVRRNVTCIIAACENMISGAAYKPGDIIGSMSGKTIEVLNTDAEGRLTLADALWYATDTLKADKVVDIATLTGACVIALGNINTGAITNNPSLMDEVRKAGELADEPVWELPNNDEYMEDIKGSFADLNNIGRDGAGTITAGLFLGEFVGDTPWVHLDIAGTSYLKEASGYLPKGATGVPVKTLYYLAKEF
ncbi:MAG: leucyl aminopeptidase [Tissierellia bacterium]|mgnify:CR=1 FL=1|nr:leucyl aminopeptidase [Tissierellia bacterium]